MWVGLLSTWNGPFTYYFYHTYKFSSLHIVIIIKPKIPYEWGKRKVDVANLSSLYLRVDDRFMFLILEDQEEKRVMEKHNFEEKNMITVKTMGKK